MEGGPAICDWVSAPPRLRPGDREGLRNLGHGRGSSDLKLAQVLQSLGCTKPIVRSVPLGIAAIDVALPGIGLRCGAVHEWMGDERPCGSEARDDSRHGRGSRRTKPSACWSPAMTMLIQLARRALASVEHGSGQLVWIGQRVWPSVTALGCGPDEGPDGGHALGRSLFIRTNDPSVRLWATDLALRSGAAAAVIADGERFDLAATRRLQLAAESGGALCLLARPPWERSGLSAAATRWLVCPSASPTNTRRWTVELLRCKGVQPAPHVHTTLSQLAVSVWTVEQDHAAHAFRLAADVLDRSREATAEPARLAGG